MAECEELRSMVQHWLAISRDELVELYNSAFASMQEDWNDQPKAMRHFMNGVLFVQLGALRGAVSNNELPAEHAEQDRCLGYCWARSELRGFLRFVPSIR